MVRIRVLRELFDFKFEKKNKQESKNNNLASDPYLNLITYMNNGWSLFQLVDLSFH